jgi:DNA-directed RNA polymerase subunit M/transcription elongation factor TFIIS
MDFCKNCDNNLYLTRTEEGYISQCRYCGESVKLQSSDEEQIYYQSNFSKDDNLYFRCIMNCYSYRDPTIPKVHKKCVYDGCDHNECIYMKYSDDEMKYIYQCIGCKRSWIYEEDGFRLIGFLK